MFLGVLAFIAFEFKTNMIAASSTGPHELPSEMSLSQTNRCSVVALKPQPKMLGDHYLMLVNTALASAMNQEKIAQFNQSPYNGLAVTFSFNYDDSQPPSPEAIDRKISDWKKVTQKDIWPWVFLNRIVGVDDTQNNPYTTGPYFHRIRGADLDDKVRAQTDFLQIWGNALRAAKDTRTPGIVCDLEFYNYCKEYDPTELAREMGKTPQEVVNLLQRLGARMADVAAVQYPDATIWLLFTGLAHPGYKTPDNQHYYLSPAYVAMGLLDEIQKRNFSLKVLSGGEVGLGYCHSSLGQFREQITERAAGFAPYLKKYAGILELGGTMTVWSEAVAKRGWMKEGDCGACPAATVEDLQPYLDLLLKSYRYNWIYGSADGGYDAFQAQSARRFDAVIGKAKAH